LPSVIRPKIGKAAADVTKGATAAKYLGKFTDGRIVLLVSPG
jgi:hypothetical protein